MRAPVLSVVVPTFNERDNVVPLIGQLDAALAGLAWEVIFVDDDSPDGTAALLRDIGAGDSRVRCIRRVGRRGLSGACIEGMLASQARFVAVMDADLQHDESLLPAMLRRLEDGADLVVASRYADGGSAGSLSAARGRLSLAATSLVRRCLGVSLSDPMSGFFMMRREAAEALAPSLSSQGFKILLDIVVASRGKLVVAELPYAFRARRHGASKLDSRVALDFAGLVLAKLTGDLISWRFLMFCVVGLSGVGVHMLALDAGLRVWQFGAAQALATVVAITWNFALNNRLTYRDSRLAGWRFVTGLLRFQLVCIVGAVSNVGLASWLFDYNSNWWLAGLCGALVGAIWNYVVSAAFVWRTR